MDSNREQHLKKVIIGLALVFLLSLVALFLLWRNSKNTVISQIILGGRPFSLELALSPEQHDQGLSERTSLCSDCGMLFLFDDSSERTFVMRNMLFPLDIIFIDGETIVNIYNNLPPEGPVVKNRYRSSKAVDKVLEINSGRADELGLKVGDNIILK